VNQIVGTCPLLLLGGTMKTKTFILTAILSVMISMVMTSGVTYSVFSDTETSTGIMTVSTDYCVPDPNETKVWSSEPMRKIGHTNGKPKGTFNYTADYQTFDYDLNLTVIDNDVDEMVLFICPPIYEIGRGNTTNDKKSLKLNGSIEFSDDFINQTVIVLSAEVFDSLNITDCPVLLPPDDHDALSIDGTIDYHDTCV